MGTVVVTGANRGIGLEFCRQLKERGEQVIALCRSSSEALDALGVRVVTGVDVSDQASLDTFAASLGDEKIDILINNAGILKRETLEEMDYDTIFKQFEVNSVGPLRVTHTLLPHLSEGAKVALVTSRMGSIADNTSGSRYGYRMSKAALNMAGVSLAHDLKDRSISVAILHPGFVRTDMTGRQGMIDADQSAAGLIQRIDELNLDNSGTFWHTNGEVLPW
ncbi:MAG: short-chain dehydrogenase [Deltaproteobacteria bacterium]|nr:short-chain dehydrogenase [Deltaproteobacteria bacterium]MBU50926.1 short-chain dehydrogenase [Deltaproteobacteria bacterium]|tara:strand:- start:1177 stop:1839 length:663 start_codon:yes stop_codon:yes gene_type:complete